MDIGTYEVIDGHYYAGHLRLFLSGKKLKSEWDLIRTEKERHWRLTKAGRAAKALTAGMVDRSALTGRSLADIAAARGRTWHSNRGAPPGAKKPTERRARQAPDLRTLPAAGPAFLSPMPGAVSRSRPSP